MDAHKNFCAAHKKYTEYSKQHSAPCLLTYLCVSKCLSKVTYYFKMVLQSYCSHVDDTVET